MPLWAVGESVLHAFARWGGSFQRRKQYLVRPPDNNEPENNEPNYDDPEVTKVISIPVDAFGGQHVSDETDGIDDANDSADDLSNGDARNDGDALDEKAVSPLARRWRHACDYVTAGDVRKHLPYAAAAAVAIIAVITVVIVTGTSPKKTDEVTDTASSSDASSGTQSFDDITQLLQGRLTGTTAPLETSFPMTVSETPGDAPPPGDVPSVEPEGGDQSIVPATVTVTDSASVENVNGDPVPTATGVAPETVAPSTITETSTAGPGPGFSIDGSISVQASRQPATQVPGGGPSTVTVVVPAGTTPPQPSTVTVIVPATTTPPQPKPSTSKPAGCPTPTTPPRTTTPSPTTTTRAPTTTSPQRTTPLPSTSKKPTTTTTTVRPCK